MAKQSTLKHLRVVNASTRGVVLINKSHLWKKGPYRPLTERIKNHAGRNNRGVLTSQRKGSMAKKIYRKIDFYRNKDGVFATVDRIEYDPNRTAFIALITYEDGQKSYILAPEGLKESDKIISGHGSDILPGNAMKLFDIPIGTVIHNIELLPGRGGQMVRSAGGRANLTGKEKGFAILKLPSGEFRKVSLDCRATIGSLSNADLFNEVLGKAGRAIWRGIRPTNRGRARNPVDHHNGGRSCGKVLANFNGNVVKGKKTRCRKKTSSKLIVSKRKK
jgi:large subunit ribosomal protein L2